MGFNSGFKGLRDLSSICSQLQTLYCLSVYLGSLQQMGAGWGLQQMAGVLTLKLHSAPYVCGVINEERYLRCDLNMDIDDVIL